MFSLQNYLNEFDYPLYTLIGYSVVFLYIVKSELFNMGIMLIIFIVLFHFLSIHKLLLFNRINKLFDTNKQGQRGLSNRFSLSKRIRIRWVATCNISMRSAMLRYIVCYNPCPAPCRLTKNILIKSFLDFLLP